MNNIISSILNIGLYHYLILALWLFVIGIFTFVTANSRLKIFISFIYLFTAINLNFATFSVYFDKLHFTGIGAIFFISVIFALQIVTLYIMYPRENKQQNNSITNCEEIDK